MLWDWMYCQKTFLKKCNYVLKQVHISYIVSLTCDSPISRFHIIFIDMGVGRIFTTRGKVDFSSDAQKYFSRGTKSCEVLFCPLETKQTSSFCQNSCRKMSNFKIRGGPRSPLPGAHVHWMKTCKHKWLHCKPRLTCPGSQVVCSTITTGKMWYTPFFALDS